MINSVKTRFYVAFDEPAATIPGLLNGAECCMTASPRAKPMGMIAELAIVVSFQNLSDDLLKQLV